MREKLDKCIIYLLPFCWQICPVMATFSKGRTIEEGFSGVYSLKLNTPNVPEDSLKEQTKDRK